VRFSEWEKYQKGDEYPQPTESETFKKICKEIQELFDKIKALEEERDKYRVGHDRYEKLRRLNLREMKELYLKHLRSLEKFDTLVDKL
jgi:hypothetical protein